MAKKRPPADQPPEAPATPVHGIGLSVVDWDKLYAYLDSLTVQIPEPADGEPPDPVLLSQLMVRVQNARQDADKLARLTEQRMAEAKRRASVAKEQLRVERASLLAGGGFYAPNEAQRRAMVDDMTSTRATELARHKSDQDTFEGARSAVHATLATLETAKQTLNGIRQLFQQQPGTSPGDEFSRKRGRF